MSSNPELRRLKRHNQAKTLHEQAAFKMADTFRSNVEIVDVYNKLLLTPPFIWEELFKNGLDRQTFVAKNLEACQFVGQWQRTTIELEAVTDACRPEITKPIIINLNGVVGMDNSLKGVLGSLGLSENEGFSFTQEMLNSSAAMVLPYLSSPESPIALFRKDLIRGRFPFQDLVNGDTSYKLPTILENVHVSLNYSRGKEVPTAAVNISPILS